MEDTVYITHSLAATTGSHLLKHAHTCLHIDSTFTYVNLSAIKTSFQDNDENYSICISLLLPNGESLSSSIGMNIERLCFQCLWRLLYCISMHKQDRLHVDCRCN